MREGDIRGREDQLHDCEVLSEPDMLVISSAAGKAQSPAVYINDCGSAQDMYIEENRGNAE